jgi:hypothetical protein
MKNDKVILKAILLTITACTQDDDARRNNRVPQRRSWLISPPGQIIREYEKELSLK